MDSPWSQLYQSLRGTIAFTLYSLYLSLHDISRSLVSLQDDSVLHLLIQARSNTSCSLMIAVMVVMLRIPRHQLPLGLSLKTPNNL